MFIITLVDILHLCITPTPPTIPGLGEVYVKPVALTPLSPQVHSADGAAQTGSNQPPPANPQHAPPGNTSSPAFKLVCCPVSSGQLPSTWSLSEPPG